MILVNKWMKGGKKSMVTIKQIAKRTGVKEGELVTLLKDRGVRQREDGTYSGFELDKVFDDKFQVRDVNVEQIRVLNTQQKF